MKFPLPSAGYFIAINKICLVILCVCVWIVKPVAEFINIRECQIFSCIAPPRSFNRDSLSVNTGRAFTVSDAISFAWGQTR